MKTQLIFKLGNWNYTLKLKNIPEKSLYYKILTIFKNVLDPIRLILTSIFIVFIFQATKFNGFNYLLKNKSNNILEWSMLYLATMSILKFIQVIINPRNSLKIFKFDTELIIFTSITTLISLIPFFLKSLNSIFGFSFQNIFPNLLIKQNSLNFEVFSPLSIILSLFFLYFFVTNATKIKKSFIPKILILNLFFTILINIDNIDYTLLSFGIYLILIIIYSLSYLIPKKSKFIFNTFIIFFSFLIIKNFSFSSILKKQNILFPLIFLIPNYLSSLLFVKNKIIKYLVIFSIIVLLNNINSKSINIIFFVYSFSFIIIYSIVLIIYKKFLKNLLIKLHKFLKNKENISLNIFELGLITSVLISISLCLINLFLLINYKLNIFQNLFNDLNTIFSSNNSILNWLFGFRIIDKPKTNITNIFINYGIIGLWSFIILNIYIFYTSIKNLKTKNKFNFNIIITILGLFSLFNNFIYGFLYNWTLTFQIIYFLQIGILSIFLIKKKKQTSKFNQIIKLERFGKVIYYISEGIRILAILYLLRLLTKIFLNII